MKGFGIEIKNTLLDPKHVEQMGMAVWLYMWLVDKMTSVGEDGIGKVLGGKPIKFPEINEELGISQDTYTRWTEKLLEYPYIQTTRTPYGIVFTVLKAHKHFGTRIRKVAESKSENAESLRENAESNKTVQIDNSIRQDTFSHFWESYPRKIAKKDAEKAWKKIKESQFEKIIKALEDHKKSPQWVKDGGKFIPYPASWLNAERWNDQLTVGAATTNRFTKYDS